MSQSTVASQIDFSTEVNGRHVAFRAKLDWSGTIRVSMYVTLPKGKSLKSYSFRVGGIHKIKFREITTYTKYVRLDFDITWSRGVYAPYIACCILADNITSLVVE